MEFGNIPRVFIRHNDQTGAFPTIQNEAQFIFSLRLQFGPECPPPGKTVRLIGERDTQHGKEVLEIPLSLLLEHRIHHSEPFTLKFVDPPQEDVDSAQHPPANSQRPVPAPCETLPQDNRFSSAADDRRASKLKKGRVMSKKKDAQGNIITSMGQNNDGLLTKFERREVQKYVLFYWALDEKSGRPFSQSDQPDTSQVELSFAEMHRSPVLKDRPDCAVRRYAQK